MRLGERAREEEPEARARLRAAGERGRTSRRSDPGAPARIPGPASRTRTITWPSSAPASTVTSPPESEYLIAFEIRLSTSCRSRSASPRTLGSAGRELGREPHFVLADLGGGDRVAQTSARSTSREAVAEGAGLDPRRVEHVADERRETGRLVRDHGEKRLALLGPELAPARLQRPSRADHGRHRAAELVRDERDEVGAERGQAAQLVRRRALGLVGAQVLHGASRRAGRGASSRLDLLGSERPGLASARSRARRSTAPPAAAARAPATRTPSASSPASSGYRSVGDVLAGRSCVPRRSPPRESTPAP